MQTNMENNMENNMTREQYIEQELAKRDDVTAENENTIRSLLARGWQIQKDYGVTTH